MGGNCIADIKLKPVYFMKLNTLFLHSTNGKLQSNRNFSWIFSKNIWAFQSDLIFLKCFFKV